MVYDLSTTQWKDVQQWVRNGTIQKHYSIGDQIIVTHVGSDIIFDIVAIDVATPADTTKTHSMTLMAHYLLPDYMMFDNREPENSNSNRQSYGNNRYKDSNIRLWLNSNGAAGSWWTAQHDADTAPDYAATMAGFMNGFDDAFLDVIGETKIKVIKNGKTDSGECEELVDKFYLPSKTEVGLGTDNPIEEGVLFPYFSSNLLRIKSRGGDSAYFWWLRTQRSSSSSTVWCVDSSGNMETEFVYNAVGVAPVCNII